MHPWWVQIAEYAKTPVLVRKRIAGIPCAECVKLNVPPTGTLESLTMFLPLVAADAGESLLPEIVATADRAKARKKPLRARLRLVNMEKG